MDHKYDEWRRMLENPQPLEPFTPFVPMPTQAEIDEFRRLLDRAREYDKKNNEPDCELEEKKQRLIELAKSFGEDIANAIALLIDGVESRKAKS